MSGGVNDGIQHISGIEEVISGDLPAAELAARIREKTYYGLAFSGGRQDALQEWQNTLLPIARARLLQIQLESGSDVSVTVAHQYGEHIQEGAFLTSGRDILPMVRSHLDAQDGLTQNEKTILASWATNTLESAEAEGIIKFAVDSLGLGILRPDATLDRRLQIYTSARLEGARPETHSAEECNVALRGAVSGNHVELARDLLRDSGAQAITDIHNMAKGCIRSDKIAMLEMLVKEGPNVSERNSSDEIICFLGCDFVDNSEAESLRKTLAVSRRLGLSPAFENTNFFWFINRNRDPATLKVVVEHLRSTNQLESLHEMSKEDLLEAAAFNKDTRNVDLLASVLPVDRISRALVDLTHTGGGQEATAMLLATMYAKGGKDIDLSLPLMTAAEFNNYDMLDAICDFSRDNGIHLDIQDVYDYLATPKTNLVLDVSGMQIEEKVAVVRDALSREGEVQTPEEQIRARLAIAELEQSSREAQNVPKKHQPITGLQSETAETSGGMTPQLENKHQRQLREVARDTVSRLGHTVRDRVTNVAQRVFRHGQGR
jgi:hypothetical protein